MHFHCKYTSICTQFVIYSNFTLGPKRPIRMQGSDQNDRFIKYAKKKKEKENNKERKKEQM